MLRQVFPDGLHGHLLFCQETLFDHISAYASVRKAIFFTVACGDDFAARQDQFSGTLDLKKGNIHRVLQPGDFKTSAF